MIDFVRTRELLVRELEACMCEFAADIATREHLDRAAFISWLATFMPEAFDAPLRRHLYNWLFAQSHRAGRWYRLLPLESAAYALSGDLTWITPALMNINHHASRLRWEVLASLLPVIAMIPCDEPSLVRGIESNIDSWHMFTDQAIALVAVSHGAKATKKGLFEEWLGRASNPAQEYIRAFLDQFLHQGYALNPWLTEMLLIEQYVTCRFATQSTLCDPPVRQLGLPIIGQLSAEALCRRLSSHPLACAEITLRDE